MSWGGRQEVWCLLSTLDRDPHPTCARCRGKICTKDLTCDFCAVWSAEQWERFLKKRSYKERKKHRPSGSVPPAQQTSPRTETSSGVSRPGTSSSSSSRPLGGQREKEGSRGAPGVVSGGAPSPPARPRSSERGGSASGLSSGGAGSLPLLLLLRERVKWELPARCRRPCPASPMSLTLPNSHRTFHDVGIRVSLRHLAPACYPPLVPDLRIEDQGRIRGLGHERVARVDVTVVVALAPLPVRGQEVESVVDGRRLRRSHLVPARVVSGQGLLTATAHGVEALGLGVTGLDPRVDTGHAVTALGVTGRGLLTGTSCAGSVRVPLPAGEGGMTACGRPLSRIARGQAGGYLPPLPACGQTRNPGGC